MQQNYEYEARRSPRQSLLFESSPPEGYTAEDWYAIQQAICQLLNGSALEEVRCPCPHMN